jgi:hypothetical protein
MKTIRLGGLGGFCASLTQLSFFYSLYTSHLHILYTPNRHAKPPDPPEGDSGAIFSLIIRYLNWVDSAQNHPRGLPKYPPDRMVGDCRGSKSAVHALAAYPRV